MSAPFVKWAGGKARLAARIAAMAPPRTRRYHEPFLGGGAVFFAVMRRLGTIPALLNDLNPDLMHAYQVVRDDPEGLISELLALAQTYFAVPEERRAAEYYRIRASQPGDPLARTARLIFLNKTCYNGLYRVNRRGAFNVPHGRYRNPRIADEETIRAASAALQAAELSSIDFEAAMALARPDDFVYLDPPYQPLSGTSKFTSYTSADFPWGQQVRLRDAFESLSRRGVAAVLSNAWQDDVRDLYADRGYSMESVPMARAINSAGDGRRPVAELLLTNFERAEVRRVLEAAAT